MIGGNIDACLQMQVVTQNEYGVEQEVWTDTFFLNGFLDLLNDDSGYRNLLKKVENSTHVFLCSYQDLSKNDMVATPENSRLIIKNQIYHIKLIDNPMEMNRQLEIYLTYLGGQV